MISFWPFRGKSLMAGVAVLIAVSLSTAQSPWSENTGTAIPEAQKIENAKPATTQTTDSKKGHKPSSSEKARLILDQAYQLALNSKPAIKVDALAMIAETMKLVDKTKAVTYYQTAFEATQEVPLADKQVNRAAIQSRVAIGLAEIDAEAALELASRVDQPPPSEETGLFPMFMSRGSQNFRAQAIQRVAMKLAEKDLDRAMIVILPTVRERDFPYEAVLPLAGKLMKEAPDKAQTLFNELIQQFSATTTPGFNQMIMFSMIIRVFADANRNPALQAVDITLQKIPPMEESLKKAMEEEAKKSGLPPQPLPFSLGTLPKVMLLPTLRKLDPERAAALEKETQPTIELLDKHSGGLFSSALMNSDMDLTGRPEEQQAKMLNKIDMERIPEAQRGPISNSLALSLARTNPEKAMGMTQYVSTDKEKAIALAAIAGGFAAKDKDKARSVLSDAAPLAEKVKDKQDRAFVFTMLGESAVAIDVAQAKSFYSTAFENYDQAMEELSRTTSNEKERTTNESALKQLSRRYSRAVAGYAELDIDAAVERARRMGDEQSMLQTLIRLATRVLAPDREIPAMQFLNRGPGM